MPRLSLWKNEKTNDNLIIEEFIKQKNEVKSDSDTDLQQSSCIEVKIHYRAHNQTAKIDVHEFTKKGHKDRHYYLENISKEMNEKMKQMISGAHWGQFFAAVTKHRIKED